MLKQKLTPNLQGDHHQPTPLSAGQVKRRSASGQARAREDKPVEVMERDSGHVTVATRRTRVRFRIEKMQDPIEISS
jgi:hypothetical protein